MKRFLELDFYYETRSDDGRMFPHERDVIVNTDDIISVNGEACTIWADQAFYRIDLSERARGAVGRCELFIKEECRQKILRQ